MKAKTKSERIHEVFNRIAHVKVYNSTQGHWDGMQGKATITQSALQRYYEANQGRYECTSSFKVALRYLVKSDFLQEFKQRDGDPKAYHLTKKSFAVYAKAVDLEPSRLDTLSKALATGLTAIDLYHRGQIIQEEDILYCIEAGFKRMGYAVPADIDKLFFVLAYHKKLIFNLEGRQKDEDETGFYLGDPVPTFHQAPIAPRIVSISLSDDFIRGYLIDTSFGDHIRRQKEEEETARKLAAYQAAQAVKAAENAQPIKLF